jgi:hypothetical protein
VKPDSARKFLRNQSLLESGPQARLSYQVTKAFVFVDEVVRSPSGKADYRWAKMKAEGG